MLAHMGYHPELWVHVASGAIQSMSKLWWESAHTAFLEDRALEQITWAKFWEVFYSR